MKKWKTYNIDRCCEFIIRQNPQYREDCRVILRKIKYKKIFFINFKTFKTIVYNCVNYDYRDNDPTILQRCLDVYRWCIAKGLLDKNHDIKILKHKPWAGIKKHNLWNKIIIGCKLKLFNIKNKLRLKFHHISTNDIPDPFAGYGIQRLPNFPTNRPTIENMKAIKTILEQRELHEQEILEDIEMDDCVDENLEIKKINESIKKNNELSKEELEFELQHDCRSPHKDDKEKAECDWFEIQKNPFHHQ